MDIIVHGGDTETYRGLPMTLQFFSADMEYSECLWVDEHTATQGFFEWADSLPTRCSNILYVHNLQFDLPEFFWSFKEQLITPSGEFQIQQGDWYIHGVFASPTFCRLKNSRRHISIMIVDSFLWFQGSLAKAAELYCPDLPKLKHPKGLGTKKFSMRDNEFYQYAMRDAVVAYYIGKSIQAMIKQFDIVQPVSLADMSAKIFRHHFLRHTIPQPARMTIVAALNSYHGGKNNVVPDACPAWHMDVTSMDIKSAYPLSMSQLPSMSYVKFYKRYRLVRNCRAVNALVPPLGVYKCSGIAEQCDWPVIFTHNFKPIQGRFTDVWIQGAEINEALRSGEVRLTKIRGHYYEFERDNRPSPFKAYTDHFYELKETEKDPVRKYGYKLNLTSLYGKFIQTRKNQKVIYTDVDGNETVEAGEVIAAGMFHPFIATAITAPTRVYIHRMEHEYKAFHTATDGIFTNRKRVIRINGYPTRGLGSVNIEARGDLCLLRNKCYILYGDNGNTKSQYFHGKRIVKFAKHGFQGTIYDMEKLIATNRRKYKASRPNRLRESLKQGLAVNDFVEREYMLKIGQIRVKG